MKKVVTPLEEGEEKTHCCQRHCVSLPIKKLNYIYIFKTNNDHGVDVSIIMVIKLRNFENNGILNYS